MLLSEPALKLFSKHLTVKLTGLAEERGVKRTKSAKGPIGLLSGAMTGLLILKG